MLATELAQDPDSDLVQITPNNTQDVMVGERITIVCVTTDSLFMAWSSNEYIGQSVHCEHFAVDDIGSNCIPLEVSATFANLTRVNESALIIESRLHILVLVDYPQFNVTCHNQGHDLTKTITFFVGK